MQHQDYSFTFSLFGKKVQMFHWNDMGIVVEKEPDVICIYGTDNTNSKILCAIPLCHPKYLKGETFHISFFEDSTATVNVADLLQKSALTIRACRTTVQIYVAKILPVIGLPLLKRTPTE